MTMNVAFMTHRGVTREENQDALFVSDIIKTGDMDTPEISSLNVTHPIMLAVIDGMGGRKGGALAAKIVADTLAENMNKKDLFDIQADVNKDKQTLYQLLADATHRMREEAQRDSSFSEMGAAVSGVLFRKKSVLAFNCGDCRVYRLRDSCLKRITCDHSIVQELFEQKKISEEEMRTHPRKNIITSVVSADSVVECKLYVNELRLNERDAFFLCSDGVWETFSSQELKALLIHDTLLPNTAHEIFEMLLVKNCRDNISFIYGRTT